MGLSTKGASAKMRCFSNNPTIPFPKLDEKIYIRHGDVIDISTEDKMGKMKCEFVSGMGKIVGFHA
jgi:hypothetical protein